MPRQEAGITIFIRKKRLRSILFISLAGFIVMCAVLLAANNQSSDEPTLLLIDEMRVPEEEFLLFLLDEKANTVSYFHQRYGAEYSQEFWETDFAGENPFEFAQKQAVAKLIKVKAEQLAAKQAGIIKDTHYKTILQFSKQQNAAYGVENMSLVQQYTLASSKLFIEAKNAYKAQKGGLNEQKLIAYYEQHQKELLPTEDDLSVYVLRTVNADDAETIDKLKALAELVAADSKKGEEPEMIKKRYISPYILDLELVTYGSEEGKDEYVSESAVIIRNAAYQLQANEISEPIIAGNDRYILFGANRNVKDVPAFEEVRQYLADIMLEKEVEQKVEHTVQNANVVIENENRFGQLISVLTN